MLCNDRLATEGDLEISVDFANAKQRLNALQLPTWVRGRRIEEDLDFEGEKIIRVWLEVEEDFDVPSHMDEIPDAEEAVRKCLRDAGVDVWVSVRFDSGVAG
jgi:hypothetical protein